MAENKKNVLSQPYLTTILGEKRSHETEGESEETAKRPKVADGDEAEAEVEVSGGDDKSRVSQLSKLLDDHLTVICVYSDNLRD